MRVLAIDPFGGDGMLDFCIKAQEHGHQVRWYFNKTDKTKWFGKGLVEIVNDYREWLRWADLIILSDNTKYLREIDAWRKNRGAKVIGATLDSAEWELNRTLGQQIFKKNGIPVIPYKEFGDYDSAISFVKREMRRFVSKPCGDEPDKALSYVSKSPADLIYMLTRWKRAQKLKGRFILQEFVPGCEMAVGAFFGPGGFNEGWCENWEFKQLMAGDRGPNTGEMGTVLRFVKRSKLADKVLKPLEDALAATGHTGYIDVNCIIDENGDPWPLEFTCRPGWPTFNIQAELSKGDPVEWLGALADGQDSRPWRLNEVAVGVILALPDFPYSHVTRKEVVGVPIYGIKPSIRSRIHPCQVMAGISPTEVQGKILEVPGWQTAGDYVLVTTGSGPTIRNARAKAYQVLSKLQVPSSPFWRPDIGQRLKGQLPEIQKHSYATNLRF